MGESGPVMHFARVGKGDAMLTDGGDDRKAGEIKPEPTPWTPSQASGTCSHSNAIKEPMHITAAFRGGASRFKGF